MKSTYNYHLMAALIGVAFTLQLHAQLPNAWQITDSSENNGSNLIYRTNLSPAQVTAANGINVNELQRCFRVRVR